MASTLLLDPQTWDLTIDASRNIAVAAEPYALAQDAATAIRTFEGEVYYNKADGVPYWAQILSFAPPVSLLKAKFVQAAMTVPDIVSAKVFIASIKDRTVRGQVQITDASGNVSAAGF